MLGITPTLESMQSYAVEAANSPASMGEFKTKRLNVWTSAKEAFIDMVKWNKCGKKLDLDWLKQFECTAGFDLASTRDITAFSIVWRVDGILYVWGKYYVPGNQVAEMIKKRQVPYDLWIKQGYLFTTPGDTTDYAYIEKDIQDAMGEYNIRQIGYDDYNSHDLVGRLLEEDAQLIPVIQGGKTLNNPMRELEKHILAGTLVHGNNPVLNWMASNLIGRQDVNNNYAPDKKNSPAKIDGIVSLLNAFERNINLDDEEEPSIYEKSDLLT